MIFGKARLQLVLTGAALAAASLFSGCGNQYRPVITPVSPSGPAPQPQSLVAVVSSPSPTSPGIATILDYSGDTVMAQAPIGPGPLAFTVEEGGSVGYTINSDGTLTYFPVSRSLQAQQVGNNTLPPAAQPVGLFSPLIGLWIPDLNGSFIDVFQGTPQVFKIAVPVAPTPVMLIGSSSGGQRDFAISQNIANATGVECNQMPVSPAIPNGEADGIEIATFTVSSHIPLGQCPVFAVESNDSRRLFVLNRGSDTISVINVQTNTLDSCTGLVNQVGQPITCHPTLPLSLTAVTETGITPPNGTSGMTNAAGPVYAEYNAATNQLVVANYDGGTISIIDVSLDQYGNDAGTFGTTYTVPVGNNPASVTVLYDGSRAYTANQTDETVTIVNLASHTAVKTLPVTGHPRTVASVQNSAYGKVYVASPDSPYLTILRTDQDIVDTAILVQGNVVDVRVSSQSATGSNTNNVSRKPGFGQPCNLPGAAATATLANCITQP